MAERFNALVLKTSDGYPSVSSNLTVSAISENIIMSKISEKCSLECSEEYRIKFWHSGPNGFRQQSSISLFSGSKAAHKEVIKYFNQHLKNNYFECNPVSVVYQ